MKVAPRRTVKMRGSEAAEILLSLASQYQWLMPRMPQKFQNVELLRTDVSTRPKMTKLLEEAIKRVQQLPEVD